MTAGGVKQQETSRSLIIPSGEESSELSAIPISAQEQKVVDSMQYLHSLASLYRNDVERNIEQIKEGQSKIKCKLGFKVKKMERVVHVFAENRDKPLIKTVIKNQPSILRLFVCAEEEKISNNSEYIEAKRDYSTSGGTQPKISP